MFGLLGPNGAGKTTTIEILEGYRARDGGTVEVLGRPRAQRHSVARAHRRHAPVLVALPEPDRPRESRDVRRLLRETPRRDEVIEIVELTEKANARVRTLSGGQQRRLDLGLALIGDPELIFLDEPTTGFDPGARRTAWETIPNLRSLGKTILLTTHYLDEAEQLADRVAVLRNGEIIREGSPAELAAATSRRRSASAANGDVIVERTHEPTRA